MEEIASIIVPVAAIVALGFLTAKRRLFGADTQRAFGLYVFYFSMPCFLFMSMARAKYANVVSVDYLAAFALSLMTVAAAAGYLLRKKWHDRAAMILGMMSASYTNSAFIGIPVVIMFYGDIAPIVSVTMFQVVVVTTAILTSIEIHRSGYRVGWRMLGEIPKAVLLNPIIGASLLGLTFSANGWVVPVPIDRLAALFGGAGVPTALFALGLTLGAARPIAAAEVRGTVHMLVALKLVAHPIVAWLVGRFLFGLDGAALGALTLVAGMPTAVNNFTFAQRYGVFIRESSEVVFLSTILWFATLPVLLMVLR